MDSRRQRDASLSALRHDKMLATRCSKWVTGADECLRHAQGLDIRSFPTTNQMIKLQYGKPSTVQWQNLDESTVHLP